MYYNPDKLPGYWGCTIVGVASTLMILIPITFYKFDTRLRGRSKYPN